MLNVLTSLLTCSIVQHQHNSEKAFLLRGKLALHLDRSGDRSGRYFPPFRGVLYREQQRIIPIHPNTPSGPTKTRNNRGERAKDVADPETIAAMISSESKIMVKRTSSPGSNLNSALAAPPPDVQRERIAEVMKLEMRQGQVGGSRGRSPVYSASRKRRLASL